MTRSRSSIIVRSAISTLALLAGGTIAFAQCDSVKLTAGDAALGDHFGAALAMNQTASGPLLMIGAPKDTTSEGSHSGSVYTFLRINSTWGQLGQIFPNDLNADDNFGTDVAFADPYLVVGAPGLDSGQGMDAGAVYFYERAGSNWINKGRMIPNLASAGDHAGWTVDVTTANGGWAIVGAPDTDWDGSAAAGLQNPGSGAAYIYGRLADGTWALSIAINDYDATGSSAYQHLGSAVAIGGDVAVLGVGSGKGFGAPDYSGYVKIYRKGGAGWTISGSTTRLAPAGLAAADGFGGSVDTDGTSVVVGCAHRDSTAAQTPSVGAVSAAGCVYVYRWNAGAGAWEIDGQLFAQDASTAMYLGGTVKIADGKVYATSPSRHEVYVFRRVGANNWVQEAVLHNPEPSASSEYGSAIAIDGSTIIVGNDYDTRGALTSAGAAFAYNLTSTDQGNDACSGAKVITGGNHYGCTGLASVDGAASCGASGTSGTGPDVWYSWTPRCSGNVIIDTFGSGYDTVLSVHSACPEPGNTHTVVCDDDGGSGSTSLLSFDYTAGTAYLIRVAGYNGASGDYAVRVNEWQSPSNNACSAPTGLTSGSTYTFSNCKATTDGPSISSCSGHIVNDVWYVFTPAITGSLKLDTCGSNFDTILAIYPGASCPGANTSEFACNDDAGVAGPCPGGRTSYLSYSMLGGFPYMIRVGGYNNANATGDGVLHATFVPNCHCDWNQSGGLSVQDIFDFLNSWFAGNGDFDLDGTQDVQDIFDFLNCWFAGC